ncbi:MAG: flagellar brake protein [Castellaniella sp.]|uniref:flagellar brake protein n=1 Tax=Castellaniella sp. TaxID=1955812 RepID=UPI001220CAE8|nr:flagellar brake protein [Castellaniella sp.]TAN27349.1 MAG: flagellar brake protein [Castellaniella sp.]
MAFQEDDPFAVTQPLQIQAILNGLLNKRTLVHLDIPGHTVAVISTLLAIDRKSGAVLLDNASEDEINAQLLRARSVRLQGTLDRVMIEFTGPLTPAHHGGRPALSMASPQKIRRMQRRDFFRVDIPASSPAACRIEDSSLPDGKAHFRILDLSAGGVRLADPQGLLSNAPMSTMLACTLELPDEDPVPITLRLLRHAQLIQENGKPLHAAAFRFFNLPVNRQVTIQQFIGVLERAIIARRWGNE